MPAKKAAPTKAVAKPKRTRRPTELKPDALRKAAAEQVAFNIAREPVQIVPTPAYAIGALLVRRDWAGLIPEPDGAVERLLETAMGPTGATDSWNDILVAAGIPWIAWSIMRDDIEDAALVYQAWQRRVASHYAHETITLADAMGWVPAEMQTREKLRMLARKWIAERFDPAVFGQKQMLLKKVQKTLRVEIVDELKK